MRGAKGEAKEMTHKELVGHAKFWLSRSKQCNPVFIEKGSGNFSEMPDVIGFTSNQSMVIECKISKSDLRADKKKPHRQTGGLGNLRYYFIPLSLYEECKDFDWNGWGVVTITPNDGILVRQIRGLNSKEFESNIKNERDFLRSRVLEIQRFGQ